MGQMKKISELIDKYNNLRGREKEAVREAMENLEDYVYEHDQLNELDKYGNPIITGDSDTDELLEDERRSQEEGKKYVNTYRNG